MDSLESEIQSTIKVWPASGQLRQKLSIPLAISICPTSDENNLSSFDQKNMQKYRCQSCKAFINKFCQIKNQNQYNCSICGFSNQINEPLSIRSPELNSISYKCKASKVQRLIVNKERVFVFILDFSDYGQLSQKYLLYSVHAIREFVKQALADKIRIKIMFLGFDDGIHIFSIKKQIQRLLYWQDDSNIKEIPFNLQNQLVPIDQCKQNIFKVLEVLEEETNQRNFKASSTSKKIMDVIEYAFKHTRVQSGKIFLISGLNHQLLKFKVMRNYDSTIQDQLKNHFPTIKKQCLTEKIQDLINSTQMSISLFFHKTSYSNLMPFYILTKVTNGELRHYAKHQTEHFFYQLNYLLHQCLYEMSFQTLLRVRTGSSLKMVGLFGNYRPWKGIPEQIEMLLCQSNRKYTFQFVIQGRINSPFTIVQFSILYTDLKGNRFYKIITHQIPLSNDLDIIIPGINYQTVNETYLKAILHNMDINPHLKKLQTILKERCKKHVKILKQHFISKSDSNQFVNNFEVFGPDYMKNVKNYSIFIFLLINHFFLNIPDKRDVYWDYNTEIRSKINTFDDCVKLIWPIIYVIDQNGYEVVEMKAEHYEKGSLGVIIDRGDQIFLYVRDVKARNLLKKSKSIRKAIKQTKGFQKMDNLLSQIQQSKFCPHLDIFISQQNILYSFNIFNWQGNNSFQKFIQELIPS